MEKTTAPRWDWISAGLLFLLLQIPAARLVTTDWAPFLYWTETMAAVGTILGLVCGASRFQGRIVALLVVAYSLVVVPWQLSMGFTDKLLADRLGRVGQVLGQSFQQFAARQPVKEPLFFVAWVCLGFWVIGVISGYALARNRRTLSSIVGGGAAIVIIQAYGNYQPRGAWWLAVFALLAILLASRVHFLERRDAWTTQRLFVGEDAAANVLVGLMTLAVLAIVAAWWLPSLPGSVERAAESWNNFAKPIRERLSNAVTSLRGPYGKPGENFFSANLPLGQTAASGDQIVLRVEVVEAPGANVRYYWRGRTYSEYVNGVWSETPPARFLFHAEDQDIAVPNAAGRSEGSFRVTSEFPSQTLLYGPSPTVWLDLTANASAQLTAPGTYDVLSWIANSPVAEKADYQIRSLLRNPTVVELQAARGEYPEWVTSRYLAVPERMRQRLGELATRITLEESTPYDKAVAITNYLRLNISYAASVAPIPENQDPVMWVLFDSKRGYCNYYASAEVLLLRSIDIPARLAVGFARGEFMDGEYIVHRRDAHAWPEVYFPRVGWVEFEPTGNQPPLIRPTGIQLAGGDAPFAARRDGLDESADQFPDQAGEAPPPARLPFRLTPAGRTLFSAVPVLLSLVAIALAYRARIWSRLPAYVARNIEAVGGPVPAWVRQWELWFQLQPVERLFAVVGWTLRLLGKPQTPNATPAAQVAALAALVPAAAANLEVLRTELEKGLFMGRPVSLARARTAALLILLRGLRTRWEYTLGASDQRAVYSDADSFHRHRG